MRRAAWRAYCRRRRTSRSCATAPAKRGAASGRFCRSGRIASPHNGARWQCKAWFGPPFVFSFIFEFRGGRPASRYATQANGRKRHQQHPGAVIQRARSAVAPLVQQHADARQNIRQPRQSDDQNLFRSFPSPAIFLPICYCTAIFPGSHFPSCPRSLRNMVSYAVKRILRLRLIFAKQPYYGHDAAARRPSTKPHLLRFAWFKFPKFCAPAQQRVFLAHAQPH